MITSRTSFDCSLAPNTSGSGCNTVGNERRAMDEGEEMDIVITKNYKPTQAQHVFLARQE